MTTLRRRSLALPTLLAAGGLAALALTGCSKQSTARADRATPTTRTAINTTQPTTTTGEAAPVARTTARQATTIQTTPEPVPTGAVTPTPEAVAATPASENLEMAALAEQSIPALVNTLASMLRDEAENSATPMVELAQLAALDTLEPGTFERTFGDVNQPLARQRLTPQEMTFLTAWQNLQTQTGYLFSESGDLSRLEQPVSQLSGAMRTWQTLTIPRAILATKVDGFGVFSELRKFGDAYKMVAGRKQRVIVYAEVENFSHRPEVRDGLSGWNVDLIQDLRLSLSGESEDVLAWRKPDQQITDFSANQRRDFFVVQIVELPETLTIGRYNLKVVIRDAAAEATGGMPAGRIAQAIIPIEIVGHASALHD